MKTRQRKMIKVNKPEINAWLANHYQRRDGEQLNKNTVSDIRNSSLCNISHTVHITGPAAAGPVVYWKTGRCLMDMQIVCYPSCAAGTARPRQCLRTPSSHRRGVDQAGGEHIRAPPREFLGQYHAHAFGGRMMSAANENATELTAL